MFLEDVDLLAGTQGIRFAEPGCHNYATHAKEGLERVGTVEKVNK